MTYRTLGEWGAIVDAMPQPRPVAVAFFSTDALKNFLAEAMADRDKDIFPPSSEIEDDGQDEGDEAAK